MGRASNRKWAKRQRRYDMEQKAEKRAFWRSIFGARLFRGYVGLR